MGSLGGGSLLFMYIYSACAVFQVQPVATRGENRMNKKSQTLLG